MVIFATAVCVIAGLVACGGAAKKSVTPTVLNSLEGSALGKVWRYDGDDRPLLEYGYAADASDEYAITSLLKRYYRVATARDGKSGCAMLYPPLAETLPENHSHLRRLRTLTCSEVLSTLFDSRRSELAAKARTLSVDRLRVLGGRAIALVRFGSPVIRQVVLHREKGAWTMNMLFDSQMP